MSTWFGTLTASSARHWSKVGWLVDERAVWNCHRAIGESQGFFDDVEFIVNAPIDILPHLAHRQGKAEIREMWRTIRIRYSEQRCEVPMLVAQGDKVAALIRVFFRKRTNERMVQFDIAAFYTFRDGRIAQIREIIDTFDLVQQVLERDVSAVLAESKPDGV